jgi:thiol-disulfide isomerase/thioredoxin
MGKTHVMDLMTLSVGMKAPSPSIDHWLTEGSRSTEEQSIFEPGKVYILEFWATWCPPCLQSMPMLAELQTEYGFQGLEIICISNESPETIQEFLKKSPGENKNAETYSDLLKDLCLTSDPDGSASRAYPDAALHRGIPATFVIGRTGNVEWVGYPAKVRPVLEKVLAGTLERDIQQQREEQLMKTLLHVNSRLRPMLKEGNSTAAVTMMNSLDWSDCPDFADNFLLLQVDALIANKNYKEATTLIQRSKGTLLPEDKILTEVLKLKVLGHATTSERTILRRLGAFLDSKTATPIQKARVISDYTEMVRIGKIDSTEIIDFLLQKGESMLGDNEKELSGYMFLKDLGDLSVAMGNDTVAIKYFERAADVALVPYFADKAKKRIEDVKAGRKSEDEDPM